jgi:hypothetical protein
MSNLVQGLFPLAKRMARWMQNRQVLVILQSILWEIVCQTSIIQKTTDNLFLLSHDTELSTKGRVEHPQILQLKHDAHPVMFPPMISIRSRNTLTISKKSTRLIGPKSAVLLSCTVHQGTGAAMGNVKARLPVPQ